MPHSLLMPRLSLRDAKRLSRALQQELARHRPTNLAQCQELVSRLPLPPSGTEPTDVYISASFSQLLAYFEKRLPPEDGTSQMWRGRALSLMSAVLAPLVWQRDHQGLLLSEQVVLDHLELPALIIQSRRADLPQDLRQSLLAYLRSLPGFKQDAPQQSETVSEMHGYVAMMFRPRPACPPQPMTVPEESGVIGSGDLLVKGTPPGLAIEIGQIMAEKSILSGFSKKKGPKLSWTPHGLLHHGLLFGCCGSGQTETIVSLSINAIVAGLGVTLVNARGQADLPSRMLGMIQEYAPQAMGRVRTINMMSAPDVAPSTHTFNPFAQGPAIQHVELLMDALSVPHALDNLPPGYEELLVPLLSSVLFVLVWGREKKLWHLDLPFIVHHLRWAQLQGLSDTPQLPQNLKASLAYFFRCLSNLTPNHSLAQAYAPFESVLVEELLAPIVDRYSHVLAAPIELGKWQHPDVTSTGMLAQRLVTIVALPALEKCPLPDWIAARLVTSSLSAQVVTHAQAATVSSPRHLVLAQDAPLYLSGRSCSQLLRFGRAAGVGCLIAAKDYPQLKTTPGLAENVALCHTKIFMRPCHNHGHEHAAKLVGSQAPSKHALTELTEGQAHVLAGQTLYRTQMSYHAPPAGPLPDLPRCVPVWHSLGNQFTPGQVDPVRMTRVLYERLTRAPDRLPLSWCQETIARMLGYAHWHELSA